MNMFKINLDKVGISASLFCALHCAAVPFLLTLLPLWGLDFVANPWFEISMIMSSLLIGIYSLGKSLRLHRSWYPVMCLILGFLCIATGHFWANEWLEPILIPAGGLIIAAAHLINLKRLKHCPARHNP